MDYGSSGGYGSAGNGNYGYSYGWSTAAPTAQNVKADTGAYSMGDAAMKTGGAVGQYGQNQKGVGYWMTPTAKGNAVSAPGGGYTAAFTASGTNGFTAFQTKSSFPKKNNWADKKRVAVKKPFDPSGKTPAMLLHELFKNMSEKYDGVANGPGPAKSYNCIITVEGRDFCGSASSKKVAKQRAAENALRSLRPDIPVTPFEEAEKAVPIPPPPARKQEPPKKKPKIEGDSLGLAANAKQKENKVPALDAALSLVDLLRKLCLERPGFEPTMEHTEITEGDPTLVPPNKRRYKFTLAFPAQGKTYTKEGYGKASPKDTAIREALTDLFQVSTTDIHKIVKKSISSKVATMNDVQVLYHMAMMLNREVTFDVKEQDKKDVNEFSNGPPQYIATCTVKDSGDSDTSVTVTGEACGSKAEAKLRAAKVANVEVFDIDLENLPKNTVVVPACQKLQMLMMKQSRGKLPNIRYEELSSESDPHKPAPIFRTKVVINDKEEYVGEGKSKKAAKNQAAHAALKGIFKFDYSEDMNNDPTPHFGVSKLCYEIAEYTKREYFQMCGFYGVRHSTEIAAFYLINERNEKRLMAVGSMPLAISDARKVIGSEGNTLVHMQSIVLARRSMIRYFMNELETLGSEDCIFEKNEEDGTVSLRSNFRVILYSTFSPDIRFSCMSSEEPSLSVYAVQGGLEPTPEDLQTGTAATTTGFLRVHSVADKIFKWCHLGVQGGLLSNLVTPIKLSSVFFGSMGQYDDVNLRHSFYQRLGAIIQPDVLVETMRVVIRPSASIPHVWTRGVEHLETLNLETGRTNRGSPSRLCKAELFQTFLRLNPDFSSLSYGEAKEKAVNYQTMKKMFYEKNEEKGMGKWQRKPMEVNDFHSASCEDSKIVS